MRFEDYLAQESLKDSLAIIEPKVEEIKEEIVTESNGILDIDLNVIPLIDTTTENVNALKLYKKVDPQFASSVMAWD